MTPPSVGPFLRWAGSKRWLLPHLRQLAPSKFNAYYEPFLGSASAYFDLAADHEAHLSDTIYPLISCYETVRDFPEHVFGHICEWQTDPDTYYSVRALDFRNDLLRSAAQFIYLNKLCFNGLYRQNQAGKFNVPYGRPRNSNVIGLDHLVAVSERLTEDAQLKVCDFEVALTNCAEGDFVYLDPPYASQSRSAAFVDYNSKIFSWDDQIRLARVFRELDDRGVSVMMSNADHPSIRDLFSGFDIRRVSRYSSMAASSAKRGRSTELLVVSRAMMMRGPK